MPSIPTPKSYSQILGTMITVFQAKYPIGGMKVGGALLTILEAAASADFRASMDTLNLIAATTLSSASGTALDRIANDENTQRIGAVIASGQVTVSDTLVIRTRSLLATSPTQAPPNAGATLIHIVSPTDPVTLGVFPASGDLYIGRGTSQVEGPFPYTLTGTGAWTGYRLTITGALAKQHYADEYVTLAAGGNRSIPSGTQLQTPSGPTDSVQFSVATTATLLDGESSLEGVLVTCAKPGLTGNVAINSLSFISPPFTGATASNPLPFSNGSEAEDDDTLRDRIQNLRQSRSLGTPLALTTALIGITAPDENKTIRSASYVETVDTSTIYIDDGNGYIQVDYAVDSETLIEYAVGGEQYFQLTNRPISQCFFMSLLDGPYSLTAGQFLEATVIDGGSTDSTRHYFVDGDAASLSITQPWEIVNAINGNGALKFSARTAMGGKRVVVYPRSLTARAIYFSVPATAAMGFTQTAYAYSLNLVKTTVLGVPTNLYETTHYTLDRNTGEIKLITPLVAGGSLRVYTGPEIHGYNYTGGLIGEANRVLYGVPTDSATYPGVIAAGASVDIAAPSIRLTTVSFALRLRTGVSNTEVFEGVRSAVATEINSSKVGQSVPLSRLVSLANAVGGVLSVVVIDPAYTSGADTLVAQSYEKLWIQDPQSAIGLIVM